MENWTDIAIDNILSAIDQIQFGHVMVLTGENGSGKSLIRKLIPRQLAGLNGGETVKVASISMDTRTDLHAELGGAGAFLRDTPWLATSQNTFDLIKGIFNSVTDRFVVIDEPEIGMSDSLKMSLGHWLNQRLSDVLQKNKAILIITHSKELVRQLTCEHTFINIQGKTEDEWLNETPELIDLDEWEERNQQMYRALQERLK